MVLGRLLPIPPPQDLIGTLIPLDVESVDERHHRREERQLEPHVVQSDSRIGGDLLLGGAPDLRAHLARSPHDLDLRAHLRQPIDLHRSPDMHPHGRFLCSQLLTPADGPTSTALKVEWPIGTERQPEMRTQQSQPCRRREQLGAPYSEAQRQPS